MNTEQKAQNNQNTQNQTQIIEYQLIEIDKFKYSTIRSFIDSRLKSSYPWNIPLKLKNVVEFVKLGRWRLTCTVSETLACELRNKYGKIILKYYIAEGEGKENLVIDGKLFEIDYSLNGLNIAFSSSTPFARPIKIVEILERIWFYTDKIQKIVT